MNYDLKTPKGFVICDFQHSHLLLGSDCEPLWLQPADTSSHKDCYGICCTEQAGDPGEPYWFFKAYSLHKCKAHRICSVTDGRVTVDSNPDSSLRQVKNSGRRGNSGHKVKELKEEFY